jgi:hypothetical protein
VSKTKAKKEEEEEERERGSCSRPPVGVTYYCGIVGNPRFSENLKPLVFHGCLFFNENRWVVEVFEITKGRGVR